MFEPFHDRFDFENAYELSDADAISSLNGAELFFENELDVFDIVVFVIFVGRVGGRCAGDVSVIHFILLLPRDFRDIPPYARATNFGDCIVDFHRYYLTTLRR